VIATIPVGSGPAGLAVTPDGRRIYVANAFFGFGTDVSITDTVLSSEFVT
jgi:DNA-binding beta-propeller fold protein YncE